MRKLALLSKHDTLLRYFSSNFPEVQLFQEVTIDFLEADVILLMDQYEIAKEYYEVYSVWAAYFLNSYPNFQKHEQQHLILIGTRKITSTNYISFLFLLSDKTFTGILRIANRFLYHKLKLQHHQ